MKFRFIFIPLLLIFGCVPSEKQVKASLEIVLADDLQEIVSGVQVDKLIAKPYYEITKLKNTPEGKYAYLAVVDFFFLKDINAKIVRKYRYNINFKKWERFYNKYIFY